MKNFIKTLGVLIVSFFALIGLGASVLMLGFAIMVSQVGSQGASSKVVIEKKDIDNTFVKIEVDGPLVSVGGNPRDEFFAEIFGEPTGYKLRDLETVLRRAAEDIRIHGIYVDLKNPQASLTTIVALQRAMLEFRKSEKPLWVTMHTASTGSYLLASAASKVNLSPLGDVMITGPAFQLMYYGSALENLGLNVEVFRAGKYKSAMEAFVNDEPSDATLEMYRSMESAMRSSIIEAISEGRKRTPEEVRTWLKQSSFSSDEAVKRGIIDGVDYPENFLAQFKELAKTDKDIKWKTYLRNSEELDEPRISTGEERIGYLEAVGEIRMTAERDEQVISPDPVIEQLQWLAKQKDVKAVVMRVDSPGGSALASDLIWEEVRKLSEKKPVVVSMASVAASGGYYIAAPATKIFAEEETITGSIGVIGAAFNGKPLSDKYGVSFHMVTQSDRGDYLSFGEEASAADRQIINQSIDHVYNTFLSRVAQGRAKTKEQVHELAQGRVYTGKEALDLGLVDFIGGSKEAFDMAKKLADLNPEKLYKIARYKPKPKSIFDCLGERDEMLDCVQQLESKIVSRITGELPVPQAVIDPLQRIKALLEDDRTIMYWPGNVVLPGTEVKGL